MTVKRVNVTLEDDIHEAATAYAEGRGWTFSGMVTKALREMMDRGDSAPSSSTVTAPLPDDLDERISARVEAALLEHLTPDRLASMLPAAHIENASAGPVKAPPVKVGHVEITSEFRDRLRKFGPTPLMNASGVNKGSISEIQNGKKAGVTKDTFDKLEAGLIKLESEAALNVKITGG